MLGNFLDGDLSLEGLSCLYSKYVMCPLSQDRSSRLQPRIHRVLLLKDLRWYVKYLRHVSEHNYSACPYNMQ